MLKRNTILICLAIFLLSQVGLAESADYHLKRLEIQAREFLALLGADLKSPQDAVEEGPVEGQSASVEQQLEQATAAPTWAQNMAQEDLRSLLTISEALREELSEADSDDYLRAKVELESAARRLRISTSPLELDPQQRASLELLMLELEESSAVLSNAREQVLTQRESRRSQSQINVGFGYGNGFNYPYGAWDPWGYNGWGYGGFGPFYGGGFYRPHRPIYRRGRR